MKPKIQLTDVENIIGIRHRVLRIGKPISSCHFDADKDSTSFHFAACHQNNVIGCVSLMKKSHQHFEDSEVYQLRGMAVLPEFQSQHVGQLLLQNAEAFLKLKHINLIWCNVRIKAMRFYEKNHYQHIGNEFDIPEVGPHVLMYKPLTNA